MAQKTVLKLLLSKYAPLSVDLEKAILTDQSVMVDDDIMAVDYVDNDQQAIIDQDVEDKMNEMSLPANDDKDVK
jgi:recombination protein RecT